MVTLAALLLTLLACALPPVQAQTLAERYAVVVALDSALAHHDSIVAPSDSYPFRNKFGVCDTLDTLPIRITYVSGTFTVTYRVREP
jgi:hypothetical protein